MPKNYNPIVAVLLTFSIFFFVPVIMYVLLGFVLGIDTALSQGSGPSLLKTWLMQDPTEIEVFGTKSLLYPIQDNVMYLLGVPLQAWLVIWLLRRKHINLKIELSFHWVEKNIFFTSFGVWLIFYLIWFFYGILLDIAPPEGFIQYMKATPIWLLMLAVVIGAPIIEELLFRGFLFSQLKNTRLGLTGTIIFTSIFWTSLHGQYELLLLVPLFFFGILLGYLRHKYNSLLLVIAIHAFHNFIATVYSYYFY
tara:strand:- start:18 stop:770 length:753 start_codon:yes stop_codon:yes gene_type:complete